MYWEKKLTVLNIKISKITKDNAISKTIEEVTVFVVNLRGKQWNLPIKNTKWSVSRVRY